MGRMSPLQSRENMALGNLSGHVEWSSLGKEDKKGYGKEDEIRAEESDKGNGK